MWLAWWARTVRGRRPCCGWPPACWRRRPARSRCSPGGPRLARRSWPGVGYLAQDAPVYAGLSVADHLKLGAQLNPGWDAGLARDRIGRLDLDPGQKAGTLSGGQRAQLALTLAVAKRPELLILDEPVASLDPLARREFLQDLMESVAEQGLSVVLSSHLVADLERVCDYLIVLVASRVRVAGPVEDLLARHHLLSGPRLYLLSVVAILLAPAVIGLFWGAPLIARELETGTAALAWNQSITRTRWLAVKLITTGLAAMAVTEGLSLIQAWWAAPIGRAVGHGGGGTNLAMGRFSSLVFATHGITPLGYAAFAFALGVTAGALIRRTVPAMAVTLAIFAFVQIAMPLWIRPHLFPADRTVVSVASLDSISLQQSSTPQGGSLNGGGTFNLGTEDLPGQPGAWLLSSGAVNAAGQAVSTTPAACAGPSIENGPPGAFLDCLGSHGIRETVSYQPAGRYWAFEWTETAIYLVLALALSGYCFRWLGRRRS